MPCHDCCSCKVLYLLWFWLCQWVVNIRSTILIFANNLTRFADRGQFLRRVSPLRSTWLGERSLLPCLIQLQSQRESVKRWQLFQNPHKDRTPTSSSPRAGPGSNFSLSKTDVADQLKEATARRHFQLEVTLTLNSEIYGLLVDPAYQGTIRWELEAILQSESQPL